MDLAKLKQEIPYKWRVQSFSKFKPEATCVAYVDSRDVQDLLDEVVGPENWECRYEEHKNNLFCGIGIDILGKMVWKWDCGTESNVDKEKGEASDAFKRAAVKWGIGRFLYAKKIVRVPASAKKENNTWPHVVDHSGKRVWDLTEYINRTQGKPKQPTELPEPADIASIRNQLMPLFKSHLLEDDEINGLKLASDAKDWQTYRQWAEDITARLERSA